MPLADLQSASGMAFGEFATALKSLGDSGYLTVSGAPGHEAAKLTALGEDVSRLAHPAGQVAKTPIEPKVAMDATVLDYALVAALGALVGSGLGNAGVRLRELRKEQRAVHRRPPGGVGQR